jgi:hypothetical protein
MGISVLAGSYFEKDRTWVGPCLVSGNGRSKSLERT